MIDLNKLKDLMNKTKEDRNYYQYQFAWQLKSVASELIRLAKIGQEQERRLLNMTRPDPNWGSK